MTSSDPETLHLTFFHLENRRKYSEAFWKEKTGLCSAKYGEGSNVSRLVLKLTGPFVSASLNAQVFKKDQD